MYSGLLTCTLMFLSCSNSFKTRFRPCARMFFSKLSTSMNNMKDTEKNLRLERILSNRGVGSRSDVSKLIRQGRVTIDGRVVKSGATKYPTTIYHKPMGVHSTMDDPWGRADLDELSYEFPFLKTMHPVGRLDTDTTGLLLFSSDGHLTQTLLHPSTGIEREYEAVVEGHVDASVLGPVLQKGVKTTEGIFAADLLHVDSSAEAIQRLLSLTDELSNEEDPDEVEEEEEDRTGYNDDLNTANSISRKPTDYIDEDEDEDDDNDADTDDTGDLNKHHQHSKSSNEKTFLRLSVKEGKYRMVRRILHNSGHTVLALHRVRYGNILLGDLEEGEVRTCSAEERIWASTISKSNKVGVAGKTNATISSSKSDSNSLD